VAEVIWTEPAFDQLNEIAEYIALDKPGAASTLVEKVLSAVEHLQLFPEAGHVPPELPQSVYRELYDFENRGRTMKSSLYCMSCVKRGSCVSIFWKAVLSETAA